jgi:hypothetical protein
VWPKWLKSSIGRRLGLPKATSRDFKAMRLKLDFVHNKGLFHRTSFYCALSLIKFALFGHKKLSLWVKFSDNSVIG